MAHDHSDAELISELRQRDPKALEMVYDRYGHIVYSLFLRITRDEATAEDLVQELFMRVWNRARDFDTSKGSFGVWILSIARNMAIDHLRSAGARFATRLRPLDYAEQTHLGDRTSEPESLIDQVRALKAAFQHLSFDQKRVLELAYFQGFSQSEIATQLNEPLGTVKSWMRSALARLRTAIKGSAVK
jgi:RNA polymerase sigma-70 factor (ECF subfamily)